MNKTPINPTLDKIMNSIVIDCLILTPLFILGLLIFGNIKENGDANAGLMYGLYIIPIIPIILVALILIQIVRFQFKSISAWVTCLSPIILLTLNIWLDTTNLYILLSVIGIIITFSFIKITIIKK
ncbi:hypothetical protein [Pedobacter polysacchareus]|uniref:hypothetical protein n=1 Tax=Pedobacter polysacchareus TaxID=2861973 RepID=UPI001C99E738|nr:hypothetical protein [Pedobacter polysacchareus]